MLPSLSRGGEDGIPIYLKHTTTKKGRGSSLKLGRNARERKMETLLCMSTWNDVSEFILPLKMMIIAVAV